MTALLSRATLRRLAPLARWIRYFAPLAVIGCAGEEFETASSTTTASDTGTGTDTSTGTGTDTSTGTGTDTSTGTGTDTSTGTGMCVPGMPTVGCGGVYVSPLDGNDANTGNSRSPLATIEKAVEVAGGNEIYVCASGGDVTQPVTIGSNATIYGGFDCDTWSFGEGPTTVATGAGEIPLTIEGEGVDVVIHDFAFISADADEQAKEPGDSSIAVVIQGATVAFNDCIVQAGNGADGANAVSTASPAQNGGSGSAGAPSSTPLPVKVGGDGGTSACFAAGGKGGDGTGSSPAGDGLEGQPHTTSTTGNGGLGGDGSGGPLFCSAGTAGANGEAGGVGAGGTDDGFIDVEGWHGNDGAPGATAGTPGQGGGGGGGNYGAAISAGGGGGGGGCGGGPADIGGWHGGASVAMLSLNATVTLNGGSIATGTGGEGGVGANGQVGGAGGSEGPGGACGASCVTCSGGPGGVGGRGGAGGGGAGGPTFLIAYSGAEPTLLGASTLLGLPGEGGVAGDDDPATMGIGETGQTADLFQITD